MSTIGGGAVLAVVHRAGVVLPGVEVRPAVEVRPGVEVRPAVVVLLGAVVGREPGSSSHQALPMSHPLVVSRGKTAFWSL